MKRLLLISILLISATLSNAQKTTKDTTPCKTYVQFTNKTTFNLEIRVYSKETKYMEDLLRTINVPVGKSKKMKAEDGETYYYTAQTIPGGTYFNGSVDAEDCKTVDEEIISK